MRFLAAALVVIGLSASQIIVRVLVPQLASISPSSGAVGASVTLTGVNFGVRQENSVLAFNGTVASPSAWSDTSITTLVPAGATTGTVMLTRGGRTSNAIAFTVSSGSCSPSPCINSVSGTVGDGQSITVAGVGFGATGPTILMHDNFESGTLGAVIDNNNGLVGTWANDGDPSPPRYDNGFAHSGTKAMKSDFQIATGSSVQVNISPAASDAFASFWFYMPTTSSFPGFDTGIAIWKVSWIMGADANHTDQMWPESSNTSAPFSGWYNGCNDCSGGDGPFWGTDASTSDMSMVKGNWYRVWEWLHATNDASGHKDAWFLSTDQNIAVTRAINHAGAVMTGTGPYFQQWLLGAYGRDSDVETRPRFDDVYFAVGTNARARVEIGDAATYAACKNLAVATVTSWSATSIVVTVRKEALGTGTKYAYVIDGSGNVSSSGFAVTML